MLTPNPPAQSDTATDTTDTMAVTATRPSRSRRKSLRALLLLPALALALLLGPSLVPADAPVPQPFKAAQAEAAPSHCLQVARHTFAVTRGNFPAALNALRATRGCGDSLANGICSASRQWWGGWARSAVRFITNGQTDRC